MPCRWPLPLYWHRSAPPRPRPDLPREATQGLGYWAVGGGEDQPGIDLPMCGSRQSAPATARRLETDRILWTGHDPVSALVPDPSPHQRIAAAQGPTRLARARRARRREAAAAGPRQRRGRAPDGGRLEQQQGAV